MLEYFSRLEDEATNKRVLPSPFLSTSIPSPCSPSHSSISTSSPLFDPIPPHPLPNVALSLVLTYVNYTHQKSKIFLIPFPTPHSLSLSIYFPLYPSPGIFSLYHFPIRSPLPPSPLPFTSPFQLSLSALSSPPTLSLHRLPIPFPQPVPSSTSLSSPPYHFILYFSTYLRPHGLHNIVLTFLCQETNLSLYSHMYLTSLEGRKVRNALLINSVHNIVSTSSAVATPREYVHLESICTRGVCTPREYVHQGSMYTSRVCTPGRLTVSMH